jgi:DnaK suppressor protein
VAAPPTDPVEGLRMAGLTPEKLAEVKDRLLGRKKLLWLEVKEQLKSSIGDGYQEMLATARDEEDQATVSLMAETSLTLLGPKRQELEAIEEAMQRLETGSYGLCEVCGQPIEPRRLEIMPETPLCRGCMSQREKLAKATAR